MRISFIWLYGQRQRTHKPKNRNETSLARLLQAHCPEYKFPMQVFVFIHQYSLCERMYHWSVAIDPVLNLIVIFLFSGEPGEGKKKGDQMSWWQHAALSKVALSIKIDREGEGERYFSGTPTGWHFRKAVHSILSPSIVAHKEHGCLDWGNLSSGLRAQQRQWTGSDVTRRSRESCSLYLSVVISQFTCCVPEKVDKALCWHLALTF